MNTYTFTNEKGEPVQVEQEAWIWAVLYKDGSELYQFNDADNTFHQFKEIDWEKVKLFVVISKDGERIDMPVNEDMQVFYFYRNVKPYYSETFKRVIVFGWKSRSTGAKVYTFLLPDGRKIMSDVDNIDLVQFNV